MFSEKEPLSNRPKYEAQAELSAQIQEFLARGGKVKSSANESVPTGRPCIDTAVWQQRQFVVNQLKQHKIDYKKLANACNVFVAIMRCYLTAKRLPSAAMQNCILSELGRLIELRKAVSLT